VKIDFALPAARVVQVVKHLVECHSCPTQLGAYNGPEFINTCLR
jgi:putative transposase